MNADLKKTIDEFRDNRNWRQFHNEKDLALSVVLEASELLECFQWKSSEEAIEEGLENIKDELADVIIYAMMLASNLDLDVNEIVLNKLRKNEEKYPVSKSKDSKEKYTKL